MSYLPKKALLGRWAPLTGVVKHPLERVSQVTMCDVFEKGRTLRQMASVLMSAIDMLLFGKPFVVELDPFFKGEV